MILLREVSFKLRNQSETAGRKAVEARSTLYLTCVDNTGVEIAPSASFMRKEKPGSLPTFIVTSMIQQFQTQNLFGMLKTFGFNCSEN